MTATRRVTSPSLDEQFHAVACSGARQIAQPGTRTRGTTHLDHPSGMMRVRPLDAHRPGMKIIAINAGSPDHGDFVVESLITAREQGRLTYDDTALVTKEAGGKVDVKHHRTHHFHRRGIDGALLE